MPLLVAAIAILRSSKANSQCHAPKARGSWPVIGHLHLFMGKELIHKTLGDMVDAYGPIFTVNFGSVTNLVVSDLEVAKECFGVHDKVFLDRPVLASTKILGYDGAMVGASPFGDYWREIRKILMEELLSNRRLERFRHVWVSEVETAVNGLYDAWISKGCPKNGVPVEMKEWFGELLLKTTQKMVGVKIYGGKGSDVERKEADKFKATVRKWFQLFGEFVLSDSIPALWWFDPRGLKRSMKETARELDIMATEWVKEHKRKRASSGTEKEQDFMDVMLSITKHSEISSNYDPDTIVKATCLVSTQHVIIITELVLLSDELDFVNLQNLLAAGTDTTKVALVWIMSLLLNHPQVLKKAQEELDLHVGKERRVIESDLRNLVYLHAIVKEAMRLYPPGPLIGFRKSLVDCTLSCGYHIPAGTHLMVGESLLVLGW